VTGTITVTLPEEPGAEFVTGDTGEEAGVETTTTGYELVTTWLPEAHSLQETVSSVVLYLVIVVGLGASGAEVAGIWTEPVFETLMTEVAVETVM
jgi:hypothetical protein